MRFRNVEHVARWRLCAGCGACAAVCPGGAVTLVDIDHDGIRPVVAHDRCRSCGDCLRVCPGIRLSQPTFPLRPGGPGAGFLRDWGPALELWEGYANDSRLRHRASSGGVASAISLYCLERMGLDGVVHTGASPSRPWKNVTAISRTRQDVLWRSGSRYSPASPCELLTATTAHAPSVFVGKPCDVAALRAAQQLRPDLVRRFSCALSIFCAGTPSSAGTCQLLDLLGIEHDSVAELRYRGDGWPGELRVRRTGGQSLTPLMTYSQSWAFLQRFRPLRCHLCPDGVGVFADIACGDPWYRAIDPQEPGTSLVVVRTVRGQEILRGAHEAGYVTLRAAAWNILPASQPSLLRKRAALWGRLSALRMTGAPLPHYRDFGLFPLWKGLPLREKARSFTGTIARSVRRAYYLPRRMELPGGEHGSLRI